MFVEAQEATVTPTCCHSFAQHFRLTILKFQNSKSLSIYPTFKFLQTFIMKFSFGTFSSILLLASATLSEVSGKKLRAGDEAGANAKALDALKAASAAANYQAAYLDAAATMKGISDEHKTILQAAADAVKYDGSVLGSCWHAGY